MGRTGGEEPGSTAYTERPLAVGSMHTVLQNDASSQLGAAEAVFRDVI